MNWNEKALHRLMGWGAMLIGMPWLLTRRERLQNPPENKKNPVLWVLMHKGVRLVSEVRPNGYSKEYWSATRVRDSQNDLRRVSQGALLGWPVVFGLGLLVGWRFL